MKPNLIVITGDSVSDYAWDGTSKDYYKKLYEYFTKPYSYFKIPFANTFGNHDISGDINGNVASKIERSNIYSVFKGSHDIDNKGYSNYHLPILSSYKELGNNPVTRLFLFDTSLDECDGWRWTYGCINIKQANWYLNESNWLWGVDGKKVPTFAFAHIPMPEFMNLWN